MKTRVLLYALAMAFAVNSWADQEGLPIEAAGDVALSGFPGCSVMPPKDGCDARIKCMGVGQIYGNSGRSLQAATKEANMNARNELARFYSNKQEAKEALENASESAARSTSDGAEAVSESFTRIMKEVSTSKASAVLSGVQVLGRDVDMADRSVTVIVGVSCKSQAAAAKSQAGALRSASPNSAPASPVRANQAESFKQNPAQLGNMRQRMPNADEF